MTDVQTQRPVRVSTDGDAGPYIMVPLAQLDEVKQVLGENGIGYWVDQDAIALNGKPAVCVVNLGRGTDAAQVQQLLDQRA